MLNPTGTNDQPTKIQRLVTRPSLHIGLTRRDPWSEFIHDHPVTSEELLNFQSVNDSRALAMQENVVKQLTVISGKGPPPIPSKSFLQETGSFLPPKASFLFQSTQSAPIENVLPPVSQPDSASAIEQRSIWTRVTDAWENLKTTTNIALPSWFANEQSLVIPTDPEVRQRLGSIYGGLKTRVVVTVRVIEAIDVPALDWWGTSDPYVSVCMVRGVGGISAGRLELLPTIGGLKSSSPKFATLNPSWNESIQLDPADLLSIISDSVLHISMWDKDVVKSDDPVGYATISLIDSLQASGISPYPILPIQITGTLIGPHAGVFVKVQLRMVDKVGCLSVTPIALQGFTRGWSGYSIKLEVKITKADPIASAFYVSDGLSRPETTTPAKINDTGHAVWPSSTSPVTILFSTPKHTKPYLHITLKSDSNVSADAGQIAVRIGMLERLGGISPMKLSSLDGSPDSKVLGKCSMYCGVDCDLID
jgi:hypothetical protein